MRDPSWWEPIGRELSELYARAGVTNRLEQLRLRLDDPEAGLHAPIWLHLHSAESLLKDEGDDDAAHRVAALMPVFRDIVFEIPDRNLCRQIIEKERKTYALKIEWHEINARWARSTLEKLEASSWQGLRVYVVVVPLAVGTVAWASWGWTLTSALVTAAFAVVWIVRACAKGREAIRFARADVARMEGILKDAEREREPFSQQEELTGEPDSQN